MNRKVLITNSQGQQIQADVITSFTLKDNNNDYIVYTFNEKNGDNIKLMYQDLEKKMVNLFLML